jgi:hypothetical protein
VADAWFVLCHFFTPLDLSDWRLAFAAPLSPQRPSQRICQLSRQITYHVNGQKLLHRNPAKIFAQQHEELERLPSETIPNWPLLRNFSDRRNASNVSSCAFCQTCNSP